MEGAEAGPGVGGFVSFPTPLVAVTVNVYAVPLVRPVTVMGLAGPVEVILPGLEVTVYEVIVEPPFKAGAVKKTVAWPLSPATAVTLVGAVDSVLVDSEDTLPALPPPPPPQPKQSSDTISAAINLLAHVFIPNLPIVAVP